MNFEDYFTSSFEYMQRELEPYKNLKVQEKGDMKIIRKTVNGRCDEYFNAQLFFGEFETPILLLDGRLFMSITPNEIQSQLVPLARSRGRVAVLGLGLGWIALKMAQKEEVDSIDIYEMNQNVVDMFEENFSESKGFEKFRFIMGDCRKTLIGEEYDFVYNDIYESILPDECLEDMLRFKENNKIGEYRFWSEEMIIYTAYETGYIESLEELYNEELIEKEELMLYNAWKQSEFGHAFQLKLRPEDEFCEDYLRIRHIY